MWVEFLPMEEILICWGRLYGYVGGIPFSLRYSKYVKLKTWFSVLACST
jgi:hypothetical protein